MVLIMTPEQIAADIPDDIDRKADDTLECTNSFVWPVNQLPRPPHSCYHQAALKRHL